MSDVEDLHLEELDISIEMINSTSLRQSRNTRPLSEIQNSVSIEVFQRQASESNPDSESDPLALSDNEMTDNSQPSQSFTELVDQNLLIQMQKFAPVNVDCVGEREIEILQTSPENQQIEDEKNDGHSNETSNIATSKGSIEGTTHNVKIDRLDSLESFVQIIRSTPESTVKDIYPKPSRQFEDVFDFDSSIDGASMTTDTRPAEESIDLDPIELAHKSHSTEFVEAEELKFASTHSQQSTKSLEQVIALLNEIKDEEQDSQVESLFRKLKTLTESVFEVKEEVIKEKQLFTQEMDDAIGSLRDMFSSIEGVQPLEAKQHGIVLLRNMIQELRRHYGRILEEKQSMFLEYQKRAQEVVDLKTSMEKDNQSDILKFEEELRKLKGERDELEIIFRAEKEHYANQADADGRHIYTMEEDSKIAHLALEEKKIELQQAQEKLQAYAEELKNAEQTKYDAHAVQETGNSLAKKDIELNESRRSIKAIEQQLQEHIQSHEDQVRGLGSKLAVLEGLRGQLESQLNLKNENEKQATLVFEQRTNEFEAALTTLRGRLESNQLEKHALERDFEKKENLLQIMQSEVSEEKRKRGLTDALSQEHEDLKTQVQKLTSNIHELALMNTTLETDVHRLHEELFNERKKFTIEISGMRTEIVELANRRDELSSHLIQERERSMILISEESTVKSSLQTKLLELGKNVTGLESDRLKDAHNLDKLKVQLKSEQEQSNEQRHSQQLLIDSLKSQLSEVQGQAAYFGSQAADFEARQLSFESEQSSWRRETTELQQELQESSLTLVDQMPILIKQKDIIIDGLERKIQSLRTEVEQKKITIQNLNFSLLTSMNLIEREREQQMVLQETIHNMEQRFGDMELQFSEQAIRERLLLNQLNKASRPLQIVQHPSIPGVLTEDGVPSENNPWDSQKVVNQLHIVSENLKTEKLHNLRHKENLSLMGLELEKLRAAHSNSEGIRRRLEETVVEARLASQKESEMRARSVKDAENLRVELDLLNIQLNSEKRAAASQVKHIEQLKDQIKGFTQEIGGPNKEEISEDNIAKFYDREISLLYDQLKAEKALYRENGEENRRANDSLNDLEINFVEIRGMYEGELVQCKRLSEEKDELVIALDGTRVELQDLHLRMVELQSQNQFSSVKIAALEEEMVHSGAEFTFKEGQLSNALRDVSELQFRSQKRASELSEHGLKLMAAEKKAQDYEELYKLFSQQETDLRESLRKLQDTELTMQQLQGININLSDQISRLETERADLAVELQDSEESIHFERVNSSGEVLSLKRQVTGLNEAMAASTLKIETLTQAKSNLEETIASLKKHVEDETLSKSMRIQTTSNLLSKVAPLINSPFYLSPKTVGTSPTKDLRELQQQLNFEESSSKDLALLCKTIQSTVGDELSNISNTITVVNQELNQDYEKWEQAMEGISSLENTDPVVKNLAQNLVTAHRHRMDETRITLNDLGEAVDGVLRHCDRRLAIMTSSIEESQLDRIGTNHMVMEKLDRMQKMVGSLRIEQIGVYSDLSSGKRAIDQVQKHHSTLESNLHLLWKSDATGPAPEHLTHQLQALELSIGERELELEILKSSQVTTEGLKDSLEKKVTSLERCVSDYEALICQKNITITEREEAITGMSIRLSDLETEIKSKDIRTEGMRDNFEKRVATLEKCNSDLEGLVSHKNASICVKEDTTASLSSRLNELEMDLRTKEHDLRHRTHELRILQQTSKDETENLKSQIAKLLLAIENNNFNIVEIQGELVRANGQVGACQSELRAANEKFACKESALKETTLILETVSQQRNQLESQKASVEDQVIKQESILRQMSVEMDFLNSSKTRAEIECQYLVENLPKAAAMSFKSSTPVHNGETVNDEILLNMAESDAMLSEVFGQVHVFLATTLAKDRAMIREPSPVRFSAVLLDRPMDRPLDKLSSFDTEESKVQMQMLLQRLDDAMTAVQKTRQSYWSEKQKLIASLDKEIELKKDFESKLQNLTVLHETDMTTLTKKKDAHEEEIDELNDSVMALTGELGSLQNKIKKFESQRIDSEKTLQNHEEIQKRCVQLEQEKARVEDKLSYLETVKIDLERRVIAAEETEEQLNRTNRDKAQLEERTAKLNIQKWDADRRINSLLSESADQKTGFVKDRQELEIACAQLEHDKEQLNVDLERYKTMLEKTEVLAKKNANEISHLHNALGAVKVLETRNTELAGEVQLLSMDLKNTRELLNMSQTRLKGCEIENSRMRKENETSVKKMKHEFDMALETLQAESAAAITDSCKQNHDKVLFLSEEKNNLKANVLKLTAEITNMDAQYRLDFDVQLHKIIGKLESQARKREGVETTRTQNEKDLKETYERQIHGMHDELQNMKSILELERLGQNSLSYVAQDKAIDSQHDNMRLQSTIQVLKKQNKALEGKFKVFNTQMKKSGMDQYTKTLDKEVENLKMFVSQSQSELSKVRGVRSAVFGVEVEVASGRVVYSSGDRGVGIGRAGKGFAGVKVGGSAAGLRTPQTFRKEAKTASIDE